MHILATVFLFSQLWFLRALAIVAANEVVPGEVVCRYNATTGPEVNYYTCTLLSLKYQLTVDKFFELNPSVDRDCEGIKPNTDYCVRGWIQQPISQDGLCGPLHGNTTCLDTVKPCCNSETWKCGDTLYGARPGSFYISLT
ncbi:uncharacterized protein EI97DRAFT_377374 [Westerdykella ornata]|uniref:LysM domain-containing protein n=1 Tax=Westerdykella ornata TaxID=318751 RepID=A0A6A6JJV4_WESOR|nr:uncharacterized protein EI97DRAFT_377374 [Westerdykella ornata]KAF2276515.1 hypothetical protein EI97DRAFT_377374 [Westerdykella ornata]